MSNSKATRAATMASRRKRFASGGALVAAIAAAVAVAALADGARANPAQRPIVFGRNVCAASGCDSGVLSRAIYAIDRIGFPARRLTPATFQPENPSLAPDARRLVVSIRYKLWVVGIDGHGARQITRGSGVDGGPDWSQDGTRIVFQSDAPSGGFDLFLVKPDGSGRVNLTRNPAHLSATQPTWAPDGRRVAFIRERSGPDGNHLEAGSGIYSIRADGTGLERLAGGDASGPAWSPNGRRIAFERWEGEGTGIRIWVMNADGSSQKRLAGDSGENVSPAWSPDGRRIVFVRNGQLTVMRPDGTHIKQLTKHEPGIDVSFPDW
jgi:TolB protein